jgi:hypothetical protein
VLLYVLHDFFFLSINSRDQALRFRRIRLGSGNKGQRSEVRGE